MAGLIRQVEQQAAKLETLAQHDSLTGVANRRAWDRTLPVEMDRARRAGSPLAQTFSAGVAMWHGDEASDQVVARADRALYKAKQAGRDQVLPADAAKGPSRLDQSPARMARLAGADRSTT